MLTTEQRIARMSPEKQEHFRKALAQSQWVASLNRDDLRAYKWAETQRKLGMTYDEFDNMIAAIVLREETFRMMTMDAQQAILSPRHIRAVLGFRYCGFNHWTLVGVVNDSLVRLYGRGVLFAAYDSFSNNPNHPSDPELTRSYDLRLAELRKMEADSGHLSV